VESKSSKRPSRGCALRSRGNAISNFDPLPLAAEEMEARVIVTRIARKNAALKTLRSVMRILSPQAIV
jgi:hypothetical protein